MADAQFYVTGYQHNTARPSSIDVTLVSTGAYDDDEVQRLFDIMKAGRKVLLVEVGTDG